MIVQELEADLEGRKVADGTPVREAWGREREALRALPAHPPGTSVTVARVVDKFGHVREDRVHYSVPIEHAYREAWVKRYHDRIEIVVHDKVVAEHPRSFQEGEKVIDPLHVLPLLERKSRAVGESTAIQQWKLPPAINRLRYELRDRTRHPEREWIQVLRLIEKGVSEEALAAVAAAAIEQGSPRFETVKLLLRNANKQPAERAVPVEVQRADLADVQVAEPCLAAYDALWRGS